MSHKFLLVVIVVILCVAPSLILQCSNLTTVAGSASQSGNGMITGRVVSGGGEPAEGALVMLRKSTYNPVTCSIESACFIRTKLSDSSGHFAFDTIPADTYTVEALVTLTGERALQFGIIVKPKQTTSLDVDTLKSPGVLRIKLPDSLANTGGYVYVPGTRISGFSDTAQSDSGYIVIDSVPAGVLPSLFFRYPLSTIASIYTKEIIINPQDTTDVQFEGNYSVDIEP